MSLPADQLERLADEVAEAIKSYASHDDKQKRFHALQLARQLAGGLVAPDEQWHEYVIAVCETSTVLVFLSWGAFDAIPTEGSISFDELAAKLDADTSLVRRLCWNLISRGSLKQVGDDQVAHTPRSLGYINSSEASFMTQAMAELMIGPSLAMEGFFRKYGRKEPVGTRHNPFTFSHGDTDETVWEISYKNPEKMKVVMKAMSLAQSHISSAGLYDFGWVKELASASPERALIVDVGGGQGQAIKEIYQDTPGIPLEGFVLQDRPDVIKEMQSRDPADLKGVKFMAADFHSEQPVKGALIYWIRRCLHDFSDDESVVILKHLVEAMADDSKILIVEQVLQNPPSSFAAFMDFTMMGIGGKERLRDDWDALVARAGLKITNVFGQPGAAVAVIECVKV